MFWGGGSVFLVGFCYIFVGVVFFKFFFRGVVFSCVCCWNVVFFMNVVSVVFFCGLLGFRGYFVFFHRSS